MAEQIVPLAQLDAFITQTLLKVKKAVYDVTRNGQLVADLPEKIDFKIRVVSDINAVERSVLTDSEKNSRAESQRDTVSHSEGSTQTDARSSGEKISTTTEPATVITEVTVPDTEQNTVSEDNDNSSQIEDTTYQHFETE